MKRNLSLWLGLLAFALLPALAQTPMGKIHGHVINPTGAPEKAGTITLVGVDRLASGPGMSATTSDRGVFQVDANGSYSGEVKPGIYKLVFRTPGMSADKEADHIDNVQVVAGKDTLQDDDMSRKEYIDALPADVRKNLEEIRKKNAEAMKANEGIRIIIADANVCSQDFKDADNAPEIAARTLGGTPSKAEIEAKATEIKIAKYTEIETLMMKDTALRPTESSLWAQLGQAQVGLARAQGDQKKFDDAETSLKKVLEVEATAKKPNPSAQGVAYSSLGEIYAHTGKVPEANAAYDSAAKANPAGAANYLKNEAVIFSQVGNGDASAAAADKAILADPTLAIAYYLKGQGLIQKATIDPATGKMVLPPGCAEAYQKYLDLAPNGAFAADVKAILTEATQTHNTAFGDNKTKKKK